MDLIVARFGRNRAGRLYRKPVSFEFYEFRADLRADKPADSGFRNFEYHLCSDN